MTKKKLEKELSKDPTVNHIKDIDNIEESDFHGGRCFGTNEATGTLPKIDFEPEAKRRVVSKRVKRLAIAFIALIIVFSITGAGVFAFDRLSKDYFEKANVVLDEIEEAYSNIDRAEISDESTREEISGYIFDLNKIDRAFEKLCEQSKLKDQKRFDEFKRKLSNELSEVRKDAKEALDKRIESLSIDISLFSPDGVVKKEAALGSKQDYIDLFNDALNLANDVIIIQDKTRLYDSDEYSKIASDLIRKIEMSSALCQEAMTREALASQSSQLSKESEQKLESLNRRFNKSIEELSENVKSLEDSIAKKDNKIKELEEKLQAKEQ